MDEKAMFEGFDEAKMKEYREEARARWGKEVVDESYRRIAQYTKEEWAAILALLRKVNCKFRLLYWARPILFAGGRQQDIS